MAIDDAKNSDGTSTPTKPAVKRLRRRSTFDWSNATPRIRQQKLESLVEERLVDVFFSLHVAGEDEPVYVSEVAERTMNPNFRFFDLNSNGPLVTRQNELTVKVWTKNGKIDDYQYLIELQVNLRGLQFIGKSLEKYSKPLPANCIIFHMTDGIYTTFPDSATHSYIDELGAPKASIHRILHTSSYDALMRLATLDQCVQDALSTRQEIEKQINALLEQYREPLDIVQSVPTAEERAVEVEEAVHNERKHLEQLRRKRDELQRNIKSREELMDDGYDTMKAQQSLIPTLDDEITSTLSQLVSIREDMVGQRRRICEDLQTIFPIEPIPQKSLQFSILGIPLPNSESFDFSDADADELAAALGYVAHLVHNLALYLSVPLPYPIHPMCSTSTISDPISHLCTPRGAPTPTPSASAHAGATYPLFVRGAPRYRLEYGTFLLNKDAALAAAQAASLRFPDARASLPNLKYLLYVLCAGAGAVPARRAGGVRALRARGAAGGGAAMSREASAESAGDAAGELRRALGGPPPRERGGGNSGVRANGSARGGSGEIASPAVLASVTGRAKVALQAQKAGLGSRLREGE